MTGRAVFAADPIQQADAASFTDVGIPDGGFLFVGVPSEGAAVSTVERVRTSNVETFPRWNQGIRDAPVRPNPTR